MAKRGLSRKGSESTQMILLYMVQAMIAVMVSLALFSFVRNVDNNQAFEKTFLARDIAILLDAVYGSEGDLVVSYTQDNVNLSRFSYELSETKVIVKGVDHKTGISASSYQFSPNPRMVSRAAVETDVESIRILKSGEGIFMGMDGEGRGWCPIFSPGQDLLLMVDPGFSGQGKGRQGDAGLAELDFIKLVSLGIRSYFPAAAYTWSLDGEPKPLEERMKSAVGSDFLISIHAGWDGDPGTNEVMVYYPAGDRVSMSAACLIARSIYHSSEMFTGYSYLPIAPSALEDHDKYQILGVGRSVVIEAGNLNNPHLSEQLGLVVSGIGEGMREFRR